MEAGYITPEFTEPLSPEMDRTPWVPGLDANRFRQPIERGYEYALQRKRARKASEIAEVVIMSTEEPLHESTVRDHASKTDLEQGQHFLTSILLRDFQQAGKKVTEHKEIKSAATATSIQRPTNQSRSVGISSSLAVPLREQPYEGPPEAKPPRGTLGKRTRSASTPSPQRTSPPHKSIRSDSVLESWAQQSSSHEVEVNGLGEGFSAYQQVQSGAAPLG